MFIDLAAAFDHVDRKLMFETIRQRLPTSDNKLIQLLEALYSHTTTALTQTPDDEFELTNGVRQGGPESPILFNLFIDFVMREYLEKCKSMSIRFLELKYRIPASASQTGKTTVGKQPIEWVGYADDLVFAFEDVKNMEKASQLLFATFRKYLLEINIKKTKTMILNHQYVNEDYPDKLVMLNNTVV